MNSLLRRQYSNIPCEDHPVYLRRAYSDQFCQSDLMRSLRQTDGRGTPVSNPSIEKGLPYTSGKTPVLSEGVMEALVAAKAAAT